MHAAGQMNKCADVVKNYAISSHGDPCEEVKGVYFLSALEIHGGGRQTDRQTGESGLVKQQQ